MYHKPFFVVIVDILGIDLLRLLAGVNCRIVQPLFGPLLLAAQPRHLPFKHRG